MQSNNPLQNPHDDERVRDHLANERTYLAWLRTGMAMMGFGVLLAKLRYLFLGVSSMPQSTGMIHASNIGLLFAVVGFGVVMIAGWRFSVVQNQIRQSSYQSTKRIVFILSAIVIALGALIIWYLMQDMVAANNAFVPHAGQLSE